MTNNNNNNHKLQPDSNNAYMYTSSTILFSVIRLQKRTIYQVWNCRGKHPYLLARLSRVYTTPTKELARRSSTICIFVTTQLQDGPSTMVMPKKVDTYIVITLVAPQYVQSAATPRSQNHLAGCLLSLCWNHSQSKSPVPPPRFLNKLVYQA